MESLPRRRRGYGALAFEATDITGFAHSAHNNAHLQYLGGTSPVLEVLAQYWRH